MKAYSIGELISKFKSLQYIAYCFKGVNRGTFLFADASNNNLLTLVFPDGDSTDSLKIAVDNVNEEETKQWVFRHELDGNEDKDLIKEILLQRLKLKQLLENKQFRR